MINILIVEDNHLVQVATKFIFKPFNCHLDFAKTGKETLELLEKNNYDLVFFDLGLPDISGLDLLKKIRGNQKFKNIRIVVLTAHSAKEYESECLDAGAEAFYTKPLTEKNISALINKLL